MNKFICFIAFAFGVGVGVFGTKKYLEVNNEQIINAEIKKFKEEFVRLHSVTENYKGYNNVEDDVIESADEKTDTNDNAGKDYLKKLNTDNHTDYNTLYNRKDELKIDISSNDRSPYIIEPEEYGELDGYVMEELTYYTDGTLADENDEPIDNIDEIIGEESLEHFGEYEDDSVFVRNERLRTDYQILLYHGPYNVGNGA